MRDRIAVDFNLDQSVISTIKVHNALGELLFNQSTEASFSRYEISTANFNTGIYFVSVEINGNITTEKIIVQ